MRATRAQVQSMTLIQSILIITTERARADREHQPPRGRGECAGNDQGGRRHVSPLEVHEHEHRPRRRSDR
jgi:hypothetical protein